MQSVETRVESVIRDTVESSGIDVEISSELSLVDSGLLDSFSIVVVVQKLQDTFDIELSFADITVENFDTIRSIVALIDSRVGQRD